MATKKSKSDLQLPKFYWNDSEIDEMTYQKLTKEHRQWVEEEAKRVIAEAFAEQKTIKRKKK